mmetsp:Transcript_31726/g.101088  ORF Transcript_31726/g.101088 Transcript_31726/m.101088 type:complete len:378 (+) Transcript_31726:94-1227(+)
MYSPRACSCVAHLLWLLCLWLQNSVPAAIATFDRAATSKAPDPKRQAIATFDRAATSKAPDPKRQAQRAAERAAAAAAQAQADLDASGIVPTIEDGPPTEQVQPPKMPLPQRPAHDWTAAIYMQVANPGLWSEMASCAEVVGASTTLRHVDLFISSFEPLPEFEERVKRNPGFRQVYFQRVENLGADLGQLLQQLEATPTLTKGRGTDSDYDLILKMHTKTDQNWRGSALDDLCGSTEQVDKIVRHFQSRENLGMLGPKGLVFRPVGQFGHTFLPREIPAMRQVWELIVDEPLVEDPMQWVMNAGSFCWARAGFFSEPKLQAALPKLIEIMPAGYQTGSCCLPPHGFERVLGTWMAWRGYSVLPIRNHIHQELISTE